MPSSRPLALAALLIALALLPAGAAAAAQNTSVAIPTTEGYAVRVSFVGPYPVNPAVAASYVAYLDSLPHGDELRRLHVVVARAADVGPLCGGSEGSDVLACYSPAEQRMIVPGEEVSSAGAPSTSYVIAHEYGHHVAANRSNAPFSAIDFGPKYWSSYELVCAHTIERRLAPGDEGRAYLYNPGEAWAEVYARLTYPDVPWRFAELLAPDAGALDAARRDVLEPWTGPRTFTATMPASARTRRYRLPLRLDGSLRARVVGRRGADVGLTITSSGRRQGATRTRGPRHTLFFEIACRDRPVETLTFTVTRRSGRGPVALRVTYPG